jgi:hypothetical protein
VTTDAGGDGTVASDGRDAPADMGGRDAPVVDTGVDLGHDLGVDSGPTLSDGLVGYWKLDSVATSTVTDSSPYGNNGMQIGIPTLGTSSFPPVSFTFMDRGYFTFSNAQDAVSVPENSTMTLRPTELTVALWVRISNSGGRGRCGSAPTGEQYLFHRRTTSTVGGAFEAVALIRTGDNRFGFVIGNNSGNRTEIDALPSGSATISTGVWYHLAGTFGGTQMRLYINGTPLASMTRTASVEYDQTRPLFLARSGECGGAGEANWDFGLAGDLDDVRFYSRALGPQEVMDLSSGKG